MGGILYFPTGCPSVSCMYVCPSICLSMNSLFPCNNLSSFDGFSSDLACALLFGISCLGLLIHGQSSKLFDQIISLVSASKMVYFTELIEIMSSHTEFTKNCVHQSYLLLPWGFIYVLNLYKIRFKRDFPETCQSLCMCLLAYVCSYFISQNAPIETQKGLLIGCRDLPITFFFQTFGVWQHVKELKYRNFT